MPEPQSPSFSFQSPTKTKSTADKELTPSASASSSKKRQKISRMIKEHLNIDSLNDLIIGEPLLFRTNALSTKPRGEIHTFQDYFKLRNLIGKG